MADFTFGRKLLFLAKNAFLPYKHPKIAKGLVFILEKDTFLFAQLFPVVARTWLELRRMPQMENLENQPFFVVSLDDLWEPFSPPLVQSAMVLWFYGKQQEDKGGWEEDTGQGWRQCHVVFLAILGKFFVLRREWEPPFH